METITIENVIARVHYMPLPAAVHGCCVQKTDSEYMILINSDMSPEEQAKTLEHELIHIERDDFSRTTMTVDQIELSAREEVRRRKEARHGKEEN